jgi:hypothetical protein
MLQVHILDTSVSKLSMAKELILLHLLSGADGDLVTICSLRNIIVCKNGMKDEDHSESCDPLSPEREPKSQLDGPDESTRFTALNNFFILQNTCNNNTQQEVPSTLGVSVSRSGGRKKGLCREIASDEASKKTSLTRL